MRVLIGLVLVPATLVATWRIGQNPPAQYLSAPVTRGPVTRAITASGTVNPELTIIVGTYVSGVIESMDCAYNAHLSNVKYHRLRCQYVSIDTWRASQAKSFA